MDKIATTTSAKEDFVNEQILHAAKRLFAVHGLAKVTMDDVARAIGKGRSSLYYYYKSKDEVFDAVMKMEISEMLTMLQKAVDEVATIEEKIHAFVSSKFRMQREKGAFFSAIRLGMDADALTDFNSVKLMHHNQIMKMESAIFIKILSDAIEEGEIASIEKKDINTVAFLLLSSIRGLRNELNLPDNIRKLEPTITRFVSMVVNGLK